MWGPACQLVLSHCHRVSHVSLRPRLLAGRRVSSLSLSLAHSPTRVARTTCESTNTATPRPRSGAGPPSWWCRPRASCPQLVACLIQSTSPHPSLYLSPQYKNAADAPPSRPFSRMVYPSRSSTPMTPPFPLTPFIHSRPPEPHLPHWILLRRQCRRPPYG
jgi:hypothetical protein